MASVSRLTVWLKRPYQAFSIKHSLFFNWDSLVMHVDKPELLTIHKMSPRTHHILFVTKSLEPSNHFSTIIQDSGSLCCSLLLGKLLYLSITALCQQICLPSIISNATDHKNEIWKTVKLTSSYYQYSITILRLG